MRTPQYPKPLNANPVKYPRRASSAFSLVEMLAVIAVIGILGVAIGVGLSGGSSGSIAAMGNAQRMVSGMFQMARTHAVMKGVETAVIIYDEAGSGSPDKEKQQRFIGIVYKDGVRWRPLNRGSYLPKGVYFVEPNASGTKSSSNSYEALSGVKFPLEIGNGDKWHAYKFDANGNLSGGNTYLLFMPSKMDASGALDVPEIESLVGIAVLGSGRVMMIDHLNNSIYTNLKAQIGDDTQTGGGG